MWVIAIACLWVVGCSSNSKEVKPASAKSAAAPPQSKDNNQYGKYIELVGFRVLEKSPGHLDVHFAVVNHSEADLGEVKMDVSLQTSNAKPDDPPLVTFPVKIAALGAAELKDITVDVPTKLRVYELPDWQFLRAQFQLTEPK